MKPNILYVAPYRQFCGWGEASKDYARALSTIGNVTIRNIYLSNQREKNIPDDLKILENNRFDNYDIVIQKSLPNFYYYDGRFSQNIGLMVFETELTTHAWFNNMNLMDKILVPSYYEKSWLSKKLKNSVYNISEPMDITVVDKKYQSLNSTMYDQNIFKFLFVGENISRKGIKELLQAYLSEFNINDNVLLIIKTSGDITEQINNVKSTMRRFYSDTKYPPIYFIGNRLSNEQIYSLHQDSQVFVMPSFGEAFNRPSANSLIFNKPVICTENIGINDYVTEDIGWLIKSSKEQVFCQQPPLPNLYSGRETYYVPNVLSLRECMRESYENKTLYNQKCSNITKSNVKESFSYSQVGQKILKAIEG